MEKLMAKCREQSTETLKEVVLKLANDFSEGAGVSFVAALNVLEERMSESTYIQFCEII
jgi:hypothetical protein